MGRYATAATEVVLKWRLQPGILSALPNIMKHIIQASYQHKRKLILNLWSAAAVNLIHAYDPEILIIGGGVMASADYIIPYIQQKVNTHASTPWGKVRIEAAQNINAAALLGVA